MTNGQTFVSFLTTTIQNNIVINVFIRKKKLYNTSEQTTFV